MKLILTVLIGFIAVFIGGTLLTFLIYWAGHLYINIAGVPPAFALDYKHGTMNFVDWLALGFVFIFCAFLALGLIFSVSYAAGVIIMKKIKTPKFLSKISLPKIHLPNKQQIFKKFYE